ncbi:LPS translocon maturation chaperone LptM [Maricaulis sp. CAU 1757]
MSDTKKTLATRALLLVLTGLAVSACGLRGDLERPEPLWGEPRVDVEERPDENGDDNEDGRPVFTPG